MFFAAAFLPTNIHALQAMGRAHAEMLDELDERIALLEFGLSASAAEIGHLKLQIAKLRRKQFGRSAEKLDRQVGRLKLRLEELLFDQAQAAPEANQFATIKTCVTLMTLL